MRIIWYSNAPWSNSGYGNTTRNVVSRLCKHHEVAVQCNYGLFGGPVDWNGIPCFPAKFPGGDSFNSMQKACFVELEKNIRKWKADVAITHYDTWSNSDQLITTLSPYIPYGPIDGYPVSPLIIDSFKSAKKIVTLCEWAKKILKSDYDIDSVAIPHGIDPTVYFPNPKEKERYKRKFDLTDQELVFTCLGTNIGPRKGFAETMEAYGNFLNKNPAAVKDTKLYMHTDYFGRDGGYNLYNLCQLYGISSNVKFTAMDSYEIMTDNDIADLYRASDVFFNCSHGEGFGKPILEASACGVPVVATDCTSMPELVKGHGVLIRPSGRLLQNLNYTYHYMPFVPDIAKAMETYYEDWKGGSKLIKEQGEAGAKMARENYSWDTLNNKWLDMLKDYEKENKK